MKKRDQILLEQAYTQVYESTDQGYYDDLSLFLAQHYPNPTLKIGKNLVNPDLGYVDDKQRGIYDQDSGKQIGKLEVTIGDGVITLDNIKAYGQHPAPGTPGHQAIEDDEGVVEQKSYGLGEKVLNHLKEYATKNNLDVQAEIVNPALKVKFDRIFKYWHPVSDEDGMVRVSLRDPSKRD